MSPAVDGLLSSYITWGTGDSRRDPKFLFQHSLSSPPDPRAAAPGHVGQWGEDSEDPGADTCSQGTQQFTGHVPGPAGMEQAGGPRGVRPCGAIHRKQGLPTRPVRNPLPSRLSCARRWSGQSLVDHRAAERKYWAPSYITTSYRFYRVTSVCQERARSPQSRG